MTSATVFTHPGKEIDLIDPGAAAAKVGTHRRGVRGLSRPAGQDIEKKGFEGGTRCRKASPLAQISQAIFPTFSTRQFRAKIPKNTHFRQFFDLFCPILARFYSFSALSACLPHGGRVSGSGASAPPGNAEPQLGKSREKNGFEGVRVAERHDLTQKLPEQFFLRCAAAYRGRLGDAFLPFQPAISRQNTNKYAFWAIFTHFLACFGLFSRASAAPGASAPPLGTLSPSSAKKHRTPRRGPLPSRIGNIVPKTAVF